MKMKRIAVILTLIPSLCVGSLIDVTPGGFHTGDFPRPFLQFINDQRGVIQFFDSMTSVPTSGFPAGWISQFGILNGGTFFFAHIDESGPVPTTEISWDFSGSNFFLLAVLVEGLDNDLKNLYRIRFTDPARTEGSATITINGTANIFDIAFFGNDHFVLDSGWTIVLFFIGLISLFSLYETKSWTPKA
jgi:hypothetical protein